MKQSLLRKAKATKTKSYVNGVTDEELELGLAWAKGQINLVQVMAAIGTSSINNAYTKLAHCFRTYINKTS